MEEPKKEACKKGALKAQTSLWTPAGGPLHSLPIKPRLDVQLQALAPSSPDTALALGPENLFWYLPGPLHDPGGFLVGALHDPGGFLGP